MLRVWACCHRSERERKRERKREMREHATLSLFLTLSLSLSLSLSLTGKQGAYTLFVGLIDRKKDIEKVREIEREGE